MIPPIQGLHIEPTNICTLKCPGCARTQFIEQWPQHWQNHSLKSDVLLKFLDLDLNDMVINLCGNYGDPIYHPDLSNLVKQLKSRGASLSITTNGSHRKEAWWTELISHLDHADKIVFSIDGLPQNFTRYRINGDWNTIERAIKVCVAGKINTVWKFIPFQFNQEDIDKAKKLAESMDMSDFILVPSARFDDKTADFLPKVSLISTIKTAQDNFKRGIIHDLAPKCHIGNQHFISADGFYSPCCFVADHRFYYKTIFGKQKRHFNIHDITLTEILTQPRTIDFYQNLDHDPPGVCRYSCPVASD
jgi:MoaA/NifB/PqqE/SkfB family radical SAM enzyme